MASPKKLPTGRWFIQIEIAGRRKSKTFDTKRAAADWAALQTAELRAEAGPNPGQRKTVRNAIDKYIAEILPRKRGERWEAMRLQAMLRHADFPHRKRMQDVLPADIAQWRDARLREVSASSVLREMTIVSNVFEVARREWRWLSANPVKDVRKPAEHAHRDVLIAPRQVRRMLREMGWSRHAPVDSMTRAVAACFIAALQTGMRAGELCGLRWDDVRDDYCILRAGNTKSGKGRQVPLTRAAKRNIDSMRGFDEALVFGLKSASLDAMFRKYRKRAGLEGFTFHDARHTAATRMAMRIHVLDLCKMFGWSNTTRALTYYNPTGSDIARRLEG